MGPVGVWFSARTVQRIWSIWELGHGLLSHGMVGDGILGDGMLSPGRWAIEFWVMGG
jgi:hypothetical protein